MLHKPKVLQVTAKYEQNFLLNKLKGVDTGG